MDIFYGTKCCFFSFDCNICYGVVYKVSELWCALLINQSIGSVHTIIRRPTDGKRIGYNTDCEACITAIEDAVRGTMIYFKWILLCRFVPWN